MGIKLGRLASAAAISTLLVFSNAAYVDQANADPSASTPVQVSVNTPTLIDDSGNVLQSSVETAVPAGDVPESSTASVSNVDAGSDEAQSQAAATPFLPRSSDSHPDGSHIDFALSARMHPTQKTFCLNPFKGTAGGKAHSNDQLYFELYRKIEGSSSWTTDSRGPGYFGLDGKNKKFCWSNVKYGYVNSGDNYTYYTYAVGWTTLKGPNYGALHVVYTETSPECPCSGNEP